ncbi:uncharacterized protein V1518DRAFT_9628 [Limtongia smithiae]|uniref:uncharacterized protein n=1 Tax=Limtongia smithiae TaxID=1125753 RepID=UPI0034CF38DE
MSARKSSRAGNRQATPIVSSYAAEEIVEESALEKDDDDEEEGDFVLSKLFTTTASTTRASTLQPDEVSFPTPPLAIDLGLIRSQSPAQNTAEEDLELTEELRPRKRIRRARQQEEATPRALAGRAAAISYNAASAFGAHRTAQPDWSTPTVPASASTSPASSRRSSTTTTATTVTPTATTRNLPILPILLKVPATACSKSTRRSPALSVASAATTSSFRFIDENEYGKGVAPPNMEFMYGCECEGKSCTDPLACSCAEPSLEDGDEGEFYYLPDGRLKYSGRPVYECNILCQCSSECINRVVGRGRRVELQIFKTKSKGWGVRSPQRLRAGTFISTYVGELITNKEADIRSHCYEHVMAISSSYLFDLDLFATNGRRGGDGPDFFTIDSTLCGSVSRYFNHSCDANMITNSRFKEGEDMSTKMTADLSETMLQKCDCGAKNCRKRLWIA